MSGYPDCETYKALYKRYYDRRRPEELIEFAGDVKDKTIFDLCAGDGRLALEAVRRGAKRAWLIEKEQNMLSAEFWEKAFIPPYNICAYIGSVEMILGTLVRAQVDAAFCQQG